MQLLEVLADPATRKEVADDAVREAEAAVRARTGPSGAAARLGLETINRVRPGFLRRQIHDMLPGWAEAITPWWLAGIEQGDGPAALVAHADEVAEALLGVSDRQARRARDRTAVTVYERLRPAASKRVAEHMPQIASFVARWAHD